MQVKVEERKEVEVEEGQEVEIEEGQEVDVEEGKEVEVEEGQEVEVEEGQEVEVEEALESEVGAGEEDVSLEKEDGGSPLNSGEEQASGHENASGKFQNMIISSYLKCFVRNTKLFASPLSKQGKHSARKLPKLIIKIICKNKLAS